MDSLQLERAVGMSATGQPFRLCQVAVDRPEALSDAAALAARARFDALLLPCPYASQNGLPSDLTRASDLYGGGPIENLAALSRRLREETSLAIVVDLPVGVVAIQSPLHLSAQERFVPIDRSGLRDPRAPLELDRVHVRLDTDEDIEAYATALASILGGLRQNGVAGVRVLGLPAIAGPTITRLFSSVRRTSPGTLLIAETPGVAWSALDAIGPGLFDYTVASAAWWNCRDAWFFTELDKLRRIAPPLIPAATAERDPGARPEARVARDLGLAASLGGGWIFPPTLALGSVEREVAALNGLFAEGPAASCMRTSGLVVLNGVTGPVIAVLRTPTDPRAARKAYLSLLNMDPTRSATIDPASFLPAVAGMFEPFVPLARGDGLPLLPGRALMLEPGEFRLFASTAVHVPPAQPIEAKDASSFARGHDRLAIEAVSPTVDAGAFPVKRTAGELVTVSADIIGDGHDKLGAALQWRAAGGEVWEEARLVPLGNDRWEAAFPLAAVGLHQYRIVAWRDNFATFRDEIAKKHAAGVSTSLELLEGMDLARRVLEGAADPDATSLLAALRDATDDDARRTIFLDEHTAAVMAAVDPRPFSVSSAAFPVDAERTGAAFASWYEIFPRSMSDDPNRHGTFRDVERHLPRIKAMGFDVLYFPPIHPIGRINRKGPNNTLTPAQTDPGSPYAIGSAEGGHTALHPELGSFEDFQHLRETATAHGLEIALDFAIQCAPDHPWLRDHPEWFVWRPDGTVRYAENPPKKYQDIVNVDFYADGSVPDLWVELARVVMFWCERGVRLFRVDNPHTKPFPFWQWMIGEVRRRHPDAVFLAEAFTRPKIMARLAKVGFSQSYTYFTWRSDKAEIADYLTELADGPMREFFRPHFFVNTPDINPLFLQNSGRPGFLIRAALAATLSGLWGVYNGFELCEGKPLGPGKEEYLDSEKYQIRAWDWDRPGNIRAEITQLNAIRRSNRALQSHLGVTFLPAANDAVLFFEKATPDRSNVVLVSISVDPFNTQTAPIELPLWRAGLPDHASVEFEDLLDGDRFPLHGKYQSITLTPDRPYAIWRFA